MHNARRVVAQVAVVLALVGACAVLGSCGRVDASASERTGEQPERAPESKDGAQRVAVIAPFAVDMVASLGIDPILRPTLLGPAPESWDGIPVLGIDHASGPNLEQLVGSRPSVVVSTSTYARFQPAIERTLGSDVTVVNYDVTCLDDVSRHMRDLGRLLGRETEAERVRQEVSVEITGLLGAVPEREEALKVFAMFGTTHSFYAFLPESYLGSLVGSLGGVLPTEGLEPHRIYRELTPLSMERVVASDPDLIIVVGHATDPAARGPLESDPAWAGLRAVREGRVHMLSDELYVMRPGAEAPRAVRELREILYPSLGATGG